MTPYPIRIRILIWLGLDLVLWAGIVAVVMVVK